MGRNQTAIVGHPGIIIPISLSHAVTASLTGLGWQPATLSGTQLSTVRLTAPNLTLVWFYSRRDVCRIARDDDDECDMS